MLIESVMPSNYLILCCPLLFLPSIFPSNRIFSSESALHIRWPKYWSFSFSITPSNEYSRLISFRIDWFDLLAVQGLGMFKNKHKHIYTQIISYHYRLHMLPMATRISISFCFPQWLTGLGNKAVLIPSFRLFWSQLEDDFQVVGIGWESNFCTVHLLTMN